MGIVRRWTYPESGCGKVPSDKAALENTGMLSIEQNERVTQTGPGTPAGNLLRHYWQPIALCEELDPSRPVAAVTILGESLVLFRNEHGELGLIDRACPHRGADLCFGRLEDGGLRCLFHGWLFDVEGKCLEQPAEPLGSTYFNHIRQKAYPCRERNGMVFAFMGEGEAPPFPALDCLNAPDTHSFSFKGHYECNWLQALEVGIDPAHASFLHRYFEAGDPGLVYGQQFRDIAGDSSISMTTLLRENPRPNIEIEHTEFGLRLLALRSLASGQHHVRVTNQVFPQAICIPMSNEMTITQWHVPIDDQHCYWYAMFTSFGAPTDKAQMREQRLELYELPGYTSRRNRSNQYGYDVEEQRTRTYTGMGEDINVHDQWAVESMGAIQDRSREHLAKSDAGIRAYRTLLLKAIEAVDAGEVPAVGASSLPSEAPIAVDAIADGPDWRDHWRVVDAKRRQSCVWSATTTKEKAAIGGGDE